MRAGAAYKATPGCTNFFELPEQSMGVSNKYLAAKDILKPRVFFTVAAQALEDMSLPRKFYPQPVGIHKAGLTESDPASTCGAQTPCTEAPPLAAQNGMYFTIDLLAPHVERILNLRHGAGSSAAVFLGGRVLEALSEHTANCDSLLALLTSHSEDLETVVAAIERCILAE